MLMPTVFKNSFFDNFFDFPEENFMAGRVPAASVMQTDVSENDEGYELTMNLPGFAKEDVRAELSDGYLIVSAETSDSREEKDENEKFIRKERYTGSCSRKFYVGDGLKEEDIAARFENGTLKLTVPKKEAVPEIEEKKYISIEG